MEDTGSSEVPNDYYVVNEGHRLLTYLVPAGARVTVLAKGVDGRRASPSRSWRSSWPAGTRSTTALFEPISTGFWMLVHIDKVESLDQQYFP